jgi:hypothetical protein
VTVIDRARRLSALRACAIGIGPLRAGTSLLIGCGCWLYGEDFTGRFVITGTSVSDGTAMASVDREATVGALEAGQPPCDGKERRALRLAASIGRWIQSASATSFPASITAPAES